MAPFISIALFGLGGVLLRYGLDQLLTYKNGSFPISTFLINLAGSAFAGVVYVISERQTISPAIQTGLLIGFCGGFTTFSTYILQTIQMTEKSRLIPAMVYFSLSPVMSLLTALLVVHLSRKIIT